MRKIQLLIFALITVFFLGLTPAFSCDDKSKSCPMMLRAIKEGKPLPACCLKHLKEEDKKPEKKGRAG